MRPLPPFLSRRSLTSLLLASSLALLSPTVCPAQAATDAVESANPIQPAAPKSEEKSESAAEPAVRIQISGDLTEEHKQNIFRFLLLSRVQEGESLKPAVYRSLYARVPDEAAEALEPFGYYSPEIRVVQGKNKKDGRPEVALSVHLGPPVRVRALEVGLAGPGADDPVLVKAAQNFPLAQDDILDHRRYEDGKDQLITLALERGYFKAVYQGNRVAVHKKTQQADLRLLLDTGPRYLFGPISFKTDFIDHDLLRRIVFVREGAPLTPRALTRIRQALYNTEYFSEVNIAYDIDQATEAGSERVPVQIVLTPNLRHQYGFGLGYGTDTGARGTLEYTNRLINHLGHQLDVRLQPSERKSSLNAVYSIPVGDPKRDRISILGSYDVESFSDTDTKTWTAVLSRDYSLRRGDASVYLKLLDEDYTTGLQSGHDPLFIPGVKGNLVLADNRLATDRGLRLGASLSGSQEGFISEASFLQAEVHAKAVYSFFDSWRWIGRGDLAQTLINDISDLPPTLRYYAGGDQSVRGYGYKTLGPKDIEGNVVGGKNLLIWSVELERDLYKEWSGAVFYDSGAATNDLADLNLSSGTGVGVRWNASFGQIRLDLAHALDEEEDSWRLHFSMGADL